MGDRFGSPTGVCFFAPPGRGEAPTFYMSGQASVGDARANVSVMLYSFKSCTGFIIHCGDYIRLLDGTSNGKRFKVGSRIVF